MAVERDETGEITFHCNGCSDMLETLTRDFSAAMVDLRDAGWRAKKDGSEWEHFCPNCQSDDPGPEAFDVVA